MHLIREFINNNLFCNWNLDIFVDIYRNLSVIDDFHYNVASMFVSTKNNSKEIGHKKQHSKISGEWGVSFWLVLWFLLYLSNVTNCFALFEWGELLSRLTTIESLSLSASSAYIISKVATYTLIEKSFISLLIVPSLLNFCLRA